MSCLENEDKNMVVELLRTAIEKENEIIEHYCSALKKMCEPSFQRFIIELIQMEKEHKRLLEEKVKEFEAGISVLDGIRSSFDYCG